MRAKVIAVINQKGGVGKTMTSFSIGVGLARHGKNVLLIDLDPQGSLTISCGYPQPDELAVTTFNIMSAIIAAPPKHSSIGIKPLQEQGPIPTVEHLDGILKYREKVIPEGASAQEQEEAEEISVDLLPANIELSAMENQLLLCTMKDNKKILAEYVEMQRDYYDYIIIDCLPSLGLLSINALVAADSALIPLTADYLPIKGLSMLVDTIGTIKENFNPKLEIEGILITIYDYRAKFTRDTEQLLRSLYGEYIMDTVIPRSCVAQEATAQEMSIYAYQPKKKVNRIAPAYEKIVELIMSRSEEQSETASAVNQ